MWIIKYIYIQELWLFVVITISYLIWIQRQLCIKVCHGFTNTSNDRILVVYTHPKWILWPGPLCRSVEMDAGFNKTYRKKKTTCMSINSCFGIKAFKSRSNSLQNLTSIWLKALWKLTDYTYHKPAACLNIAEVMYCLAFSKPKVRYCRKSGHI